ncbi:MAG: hypothetical protein ATN32_05275 [Candidatus Epulonipiscium fishelsonii]|nr:MAG: hypothetical protein ATN32_05275 [Epulopiscium sp. AS2M-Bin002]
MLKQLKIFLLNNTITNTTFSVIISIAILAFDKLNGQNTINAINSTTIFIFGVSLSLIWSYYIIKEEIAICLKNISIKQFIFWTSIGYLFIFLLINSIEIFMSITTDLSLTPTNEVLLIENTLENPIPMLFYIIIVGPIREELVFRYSLIGKNKSYIWPKIILSSIFFGLIHLANGPIVYTLSYMACGLILGYVYKKNNFNILYPIVLHIFNNIIGVIISFS